MIALILASLWVGDRIALPNDSLLCLAIGYEHSGDFYWPAGQRLWIKTDRGWVRDTVMLVKVPGILPGTWVSKPLPRSGMMVPRERVLHQIGKKNHREGAVILGVFPVNHEAKVKKVEARR